MEILLMSDN